MKISEKMIAVLAVLACVWGFDLPISTPEEREEVRRAAGLVPLHFDPEAKSSAFLSDTPEAYSSLVIRFAEEALPELTSLAEFVQRLSTETRQTRRAFLSAKTRLDIHLGHLPPSPPMNVPPELSAEAARAAPFERFFIFIRSENSLAKRLNFWRDFIACKSSSDFYRVFSRFSRAVITRNFFVDTCAEFSERLASLPADHRLKIACNFPENNFLDLPAEQIRKFFWENLAELNPEIPDFTTAVSAFPPEFNSAEFSFCSEISTRCLLLFSNFTAALGAPVADFFSPHAVLEAFGKVIVSIDPRRQRGMALEISDGPLLAEAVALGAKPGSNFSKIFSPLAGRKIGSFWKNYFSATTADEMTLNFQAAYQEVRFARLQAAINRATHSRRLGRSYLAAVLRSRQDLTTERELLAIFSPRDAAELVAGLAESQNKLCRKVKLIFSANLKYRYLTNIEGGEECSICQGEVSGTVAVTPCRHFFCPGCLGRWFAIKMDCPNCKRLLPRPGRGETLLRP